jgi:7-cyano-7-deazaguanine synthase
MMTDASQPREKAVVLLSGGLDSMVVAGLAREAGREVCALTIDYNQRHRVELEAAARVAAMIGVERHIVLPLDLTRFGGSALTADIDVPKGGVEPGIPVTYVPARNTIFLSLALGFAEACGARSIWIGVNALDYSGYPDCRPEFVRAFQDLANLATKAGVEGDRFTRRDPAAAHDQGRYRERGRAARAGRRDELVLLRSRPHRRRRHCGTCDACRLRAKGFVEAGLPDPTLYAGTPPA